MSVVNGDVEQIWLSDYIVDGKLAIPPQAKANAEKVACWEILEANFEGRDYLLKKNGIEIKSPVFWSVEELNGEFTLPKATNSGEIFILNLYPKQPANPLFNSNGIELIYLGRDFSFSTLEINNGERDGDKITITNMSKPLCIRRTIQTKCAREMVSTTEWLQFSLKDIWTMRNKFVYSYRQLLLRHCFRLAPNLPIKPRIFRAIPRRYFIKLDDVELDQSAEFPLTPGKLYRLTQGIIFNHKIVISETKTISIPHVPSKYISGDLWPYSRKQSLNSALDVFPNGTFELRPAFESQSYGFIEIVGTKPTKQQFSLRLHPVQVGSFRCLYHTFPDPHDQTQAMWPFCNYDIVKLILNEISGTARDYLRYVCKQWFNGLAQDPRQTLFLEYQNGVVKVTTFSGVPVSFHDSGDEDDIQ
jgi:hypothetical protein